MEGYKDGVPDAKQKDMWEEGFRDCAIDDIAMYYQLHPEDGVIVYNKGKIAEGGDKGGDNDGSRDDNDDQGMNC